MYSDATYPDNAFGAPGKGLDTPNPQSLSCWHQKGWQIDEMNYRHSVQVGNPLVAADAIPPVCHGSDHNIKAFITPVDIFVEQGENRKSEKCRVIDKVQSRARKPSWRVPWSIANKQVS